MKGFGRSTNPLDDRFLQFEFKRTHLYVNVRRRKLLNCVLLAMYLLKMIRVVVIEGI